MKFSFFLAEYLSPSLSPAGKEQAAKLSLPRASSLNENVDHSALLKLGATVSERINRFDAKPGDNAGLSKLQETRRIFEQRTLQVRMTFFFHLPFCSQIDGADWNEWNE